MNFYFRSLESQNIYFLQIHQMSTVNDSTLPMLFHALYLNNELYVNPCQLFVTYFNL